MTLRYTNGHTIDAVLLSRSEGRMRVALKGHDDIVELNEVNGTWVTDECEPVQVSFEFQRPVMDAVSEEDCICSPALAARLIHMLLSVEDSVESSPTSAIATPELEAKPALVV